METFSHSSIQAFRTCERLFKHKYVARQYPKKRPIYFAIGSTFDKFVQLFYEMKGQNVDGLIKESLREFESVDKGLLTPKERQDLELDINRTEAMSRAYAQIYKEDFREFPTMIAQKELQLSKIPFTGKIDCIFQDAGGLWWILETKTASNINPGDVKRVHIDAQVLGYAVLARRIIGKFPEGIIYNVAKKSQLRRRGAESLEQFKERVRIDYEQNWLTKELFVRYKVHLSMIHINAWKAETTDTIRKIQTKLAEGDNAVWCKNTGACKGAFGLPCEYLQACKDGFYSPITYRESTKGGH